MENLPQGKQEALINNICEAVAILHRSVKERKTRELIEVIKNENGKYKGIQK